MNTLSVVIPNYNNSKYLTQCIESVMGQTYEGLIEIIIVDDCSTDESRDVILSLAEKYSKVKPLLLEKNGRVSAARNAGLMAAEGEYITFLDADDCYYNKDKLSCEMALIEKHRELGKDIVAYSSIVKMSNDGSEYTEPNIPKNKYFEEKIYNKMLIDLRSSVVMRDYCVKTDILREIGGYNVENSLFEDYELILKIAKNYEFYYTEVTGTAYRDSVAGLSKKPYKVLLDAKNRVINNQLRQEPPIKRVVFKAIRAFLGAGKKIYRKLRSNG